VLVGPDLEHFAAPGVELTGTVTDAHLAELYREASLFLFPSRCEGFGLPALEAARLGTPVLAARATALEELWEDAALLLPPTDARAWAQTVDGLLADPSAREALASRCIERSLTYASWDRLLQAADLAYGSGFER
jgi:glycosyltransferase involved in cell wall biosynthesis